MWPEEAPFHAPVFVVTHEKRDPWKRPGGTTFHFVNDGIEPALDQIGEQGLDRRGVLGRPFAHSQQMLLARWVDP